MLTPASGEPRPIGAGYRRAAAVHAPGIVELLRRYGVRCPAPGLRHRSRVTVGADRLLLTRRSENATVVCVTPARRLAQSCVRPTLLWLRLIGAPDHARSCGNRVRVLDVGITVPRRLLGVSIRTWRSSRVGGADAGGVGRLARCADHVVEAAERSSLA